ARLTLQCRGNLNLGRPFQGKPVGEDDRHSFAARSVQEATKSLHELGADVLGVVTPNTQVEHRDRGVAGAEMEVLGLGNDKCRGCHEFLPTPQAYVGCDQFYANPACHATTLKAGNAVGVSGQETRDWLPTVLIKSSFCGHPSLMFTREHLGRPARKQ